MTVIDDRIRSAARRIVRECANVRAGEHVYIEGRMDAAEYLELLAFECERLGATAFVAPRSDAHVHRRLLELPAGAARDGRRASSSRRSRAADVVFVVRMEHGDPVLFADVSPGAGRRRRPRPQAALRPLLRREPALDRHRLPDPGAGGGLRSRLRRLQRDVLAQPRCRLRGAAEQGPTRSPPRSTGAQAGAHHVAQGDGRHPRHRRPAARQGRRRRRPGDRPLEPAGRRGLPGAARGPEPRARWCSTSPSWTGGASRTSRCASRPAAGRWSARPGSSSSCSGSSPPRGAGADVIGELGIGINPAVGAAVRLHAHRREDPRDRPPRARRQRDARRGEPVAPALGHDDPAARPSRSTGGRWPVTRAGGVASV